MPTVIIDTSQPTANTDPAILRLSDKDSLRISTISGGAKTQIRKPAKPSHYFLDLQRTPAASCHLQCRNHDHKPSSA